MFDLHTRVCQSFSSFYYLSGAHMGCVSSFWICTQGCVSLFHLSVLCLLHTWVGCQKCCTHELSYSMMFHKQLPSIQHASMCFQAIFLYMYVCLEVRQTERQTDRQADRQTDMQTHRQADTQTGRHTDRQTDTQTSRHTDMCICHLHKKCLQQI